MNGIRTRRARAGFTLVELMVALVAGSFAVAGVYYLNGVSSRTFSEQMRVSDLQMSLRSAMEQLRRDFSRAGYLATPNSRLIPDCEGNLVASGAAPVSSRWVRALQVTRDGSPVAARTVLGITPGNLNKTRADRVVAWGNYATSDAYLSDPSSTSSTVIRFQTDSESFRRSFFDPTTDGSAATFNGARFTRAFATGMVRVEHEGRVFFRDVVSVDAVTPSITVAALPTCFDPTRWTAVSPLTAIEYQLESVAIAELARLQTPGAPVGTARTLLVRRELNREDAPIAGALRVVLDYAVEFSVAAVVNEAAATAVPTWDLRRTATELADESANTPENFRSLIVTLSSRSADADPKLPSVPRSRFDHATLLDSPLLTFVMRDAASPGAEFRSRVRTLRSEIFLQNL